MFRKRCPCCGEIKNKTEFWRNNTSNSKHKLATYCKGCSVKFRKEWAKKNKRRISFLKRRWNKSEKGIKYSFQVNRSVKRQKIKLKNKKKNFITINKRGYHQNTKIHLPIRRTLRKLVDMRNYLRKVKENLTNIQEETRKYEKTK